MTESLLIKVICGNRGAIDHGELADIGSGFMDLRGAFDVVNGHTELFCNSAFNGNKRIVAKTKVRLCKASDCSGCNNLHLCKFYLYGVCQGRRRRCRFCHDLNSEHNAKILMENSLQDLDRSELCTLLLQNDNTLLPSVCFSYNKGSGEYGNCPDQESCRRLHICDKYLRGTCQAGGNCLRSHDFFEPHPMKTLQERGVPNELIGSVLSVYQNIQAMKNHSNAVSNSKIAEICLYFVKGSCNQKERCWRVHFNMPYKWEVKETRGWSALPENEKIEKDYCNPAKIHSEELEPVCFDTMNKGLSKVRRLSTASSVVQPTFVLTTEWAWYWEDDYGKWTQYTSIKEMPRLSSITSEDLERRYQEDRNAVVKFTAGSQAYELSFRDMIQMNERNGTKRAVRRRPVFVSSDDVKKSRTSKKGPLNLNPNFKAVPRVWDKFSIPDTGYKKVPLESFSEDYKKVLDLFLKTMKGFSISSIERIQNRALWEVFQWQRDLMRKRNAGRNITEKMLFHSTESRHIEAICLQNFDWRICGTHGTAYGKGRYFARDAKYSHSYTNFSGPKAMFVCQVLVGNYAKGNPSFLRPPSKDGGVSIFYDSCVDNVHDPSIFVVFEKHQVYPEYLIKYDEEAIIDELLVQAPPPANASSVISRPVQAPPPANASSVISKPVQAPPTANVSSVISKPVQAPPPANASSVISKPVQAPPPANASSVISKPVQAPPPANASSVISRPVQAPPPANASSVISKPVRAPPPSNASSVISKPVRASLLISATYVISKSALESGSPQASSVISKPALDPFSPNASSVISKSVQDPFSPSASSVISKHVLDPFSPSASSVISKHVRDPLSPSASSVISKPVRDPFSPNASSVISKHVRDPLSPSASYVISKHVRDPLSPSASYVISKPVRDPLSTSASSVISKPVRDSFSSPSQIGLAAPAIQPPSDSARSLSRPLLSTVATSSTSTQQHGRSAREKDKCVIF